MPFLDQKWVNLPNKRFSENLLINLVLIIHAYLHSKKVRYQSINKILTIKEYWNLIDRESFLAIIWEPDFSQACSFVECCRTIRTFVLYQSFFFIKIISFRKTKWANCENLRTDYREDGQMEGQTLFQDPSGHVWLSNKRNHKRSLRSNIALQL